MFTGLIEDLGLVTGLRRDGAGIDLEIHSELSGELSEGASIAVNGVCLTATEVHAASFGAHAMAQTLRTTALAALVPGRHVNLELPLRLGDRLGGHIVQGHVDGVCEVIATRSDGSSKVLALAHEPAIARHLVEKGSVALDGVSLTISFADEERFEVCLIPETLRRTTLGRAAAGDTLNVEVDVLSKHVERLLQGVPARR